MRSQALPKPIAAVVPETPERRLWRAQRQWMEQHGDTRFTPEGARRDRVGTLEAMAEAAFQTAIETVGLRRMAEASALDIRLVELELPLARLPAAFDGYSILHLSDLHLDGHPALVDRILAAAGGAPADLVVLTGDYLFANGGAHDAIVEPVARLAAALAAPNGILAVLGNHDTAALVPVFEEAGVTCLINEGKRLTRSGSILAITGLDDVHRFYSDAALASLQALRPRADELGIALVHSPELAPEAAEQGYGLYLCGHTHGGQVCLPGGIPVLTHMDRRGGRVPRRLARGRWRLGDLVGVTNLGAGFSGVAARFSAPPQVLRLVLRRHQPRSWVDSGKR
jgi:predicted MPP superfamily phosphohydrolase